MLIYCFLVALLRRAASRLTSIQKIITVFNEAMSVGCQCSMIDAPFTAFPVHVLWRLCSRSRRLSRLSIGIQYDLYDCFFPDGKRDTPACSYVRSPCKWCAVWAGLCLPPERNKARSLTVRLKNNLKVIIASLPYLIPPSKYYSTNF